MGRYIHADSLEEAKKKGKRIEKAQNRTYPKRKIKFKSVKKTAKEGLYYAYYDVEGWT